jgi:sucrose phosphorylase
MKIRFDGAYCSWWSSKKLYGADGKKISYYQVNATYFSALGEKRAKLLLVRAIQMFIPGIPSNLVFGYFFAGANDYETVGRKMV